MRVCEFIRVLEKTDKGIVPRRTLISGIMSEINCQERHRQGLTIDGEADRAKNRRCEGYWRGWQ